MIGLERINVLLDEIAETFPAALFEQLNGGIVLLPDSKYHEEARENDLYIMGEYVRDRMMGNYIVIYGGSFQRLYGEGSERNMKRRLEETLKHEFVHHVEALAGDKDLEIEDERNLAAYRKRGK
ncbi:MAG TPA: hypothetical protein DEB31_10835 [Clostridiales bacterium]|nr:hypothetical protein [Clostridiales bacterium]